MAYDEELAERMRGYLKSRKGMIEKNMFGGIGFLMNGNMACGVNKQDFIVRLSEADFAQALTKPHVRVFDMGGRPMKGWIMISQKGIASDKVLFSWIEKGISFAKSLPTK